MAIDMTIFSDPAIITLISATVGGIASKLMEAFHLKKNNKQDEVRGLNEEITMWKDKYYRCVESGIKNKAIIHGIEDEQLFDTPEDNQIIEEEK